MSEMKKIRTRGEIPAQDRWATEDLYASDELWEQEFATLAADKEAFLAYRGRLGDSAQVLFDYFEKVENVGVKVSRLASYAMRKADEDTRNPVYQEMRGRFSSAVSAMYTVRSFETPEIMAISDEKLEGFYAEYPKLERYRRGISNERRLRDHVLPEAQEQLLSSARDIANNPTETFGMLANADLKFPNAVDGQGAQHPVTNGNFVAHQYSDDRVLRRSAYEQMYGTMDNFKNTAAALLNGEMKQRKFFATAHKYDSTLDAALSRTNVPTSVYHNLIETVHQNLDKLHRYVRLRKKLLGVDELHFYDIYAKLVPGVDKEIPIQQAKDTIYEALAPLGEDYRAILKEGFESRWIDVYENEGKRSGAYSAGSPVHPYVLMNYNDNLNSQFTLAHEMGHALHTYLSNRKQNPVDANYVIFVAEVASTCNEALLMEHLLGKTTDKRERAYLINHFLEQFKGTLYRQTMFAEFELMMGRMAEQGIPLTAQRLCAEYKKLNELYYGPDMVVDDLVAVEWARIPHFYMNYYVFQYATGYSAAIALSQRILREGEPAVKDYLEFLSGGCSKSPVDLLKDAGVDMSSPEPVQQALQLFDRLLDEMEELMKD